MISKIREEFINLAIVSFKPIDTFNFVTLECFSDNESLRIKNLSEALTTNIDMDEAAETA
jgi:hypothetical protein